MSTTTTIGGTHLRLSCLIVGFYIGLAIAFLLTLATGLSGLLGIIALLGMTGGIMLILAISCSKSGDLLGLVDNFKLGDSEPVPEPRATPAPPEKPVDVEGNVAAAKRKTIEGLDRATDAVMDAPAKVSAKAGDLSDKAKANVASAVARAKEALGDVTGEGKATDDLAAPRGQQTADIPGEDDLQQIKGVGPQIAGVLKELGVTRFEQIAAWTDEDVQRVGERLDSMAGRIERDDWIGQAKDLAAKK